MTSNRVGPYQWGAPFLSRDQWVSSGAIVNEDLWVKENYLGDLQLLDGPIYRIMKAEHLAADASHGYLTLPRVIGWDDPYEGAFLRRCVPIFNPSRGINEWVGLDGLCKDMFGLCWMRGEESDAIWRIYDPEGKCVRLETTVNTLMRTLYHVRTQSEEGFPDRARIVLYMGDVRYMGQHDLEKWMRTPAHHVIQDDSGREIAKKMLVKREQFAHEKEVRLLYHYHERVQQRRDCDPTLLSNERGRYTVNGRAELLPRLIRLPFNWSCIKKVMIGPFGDQKTKSDTINIVKQALPNAALEASQLYVPPSTPAVW